MGGVLRKFHGKLRDMTELKFNAKTFHIKKSRHLRQPTKIYIYIYPPKKEIPNAIKY